MSLLFRDTTTATIEGALQTLQRASDMQRLIVEYGRLRGDATSSVMRRFEINSALRRFVVESIVG